MSRLVSFQPKQPGISVPRGSLFDVIYELSDPPDPGDKIAVTCGDQFTVEPPEIQPTSKQDTVQLKISGAKPGDVEVTGTLLVPDGFVQRVS